MMGFLQKTRSRAFLLLWVIMVTAVPTAAWYAGGLEWEERSERIITPISISEGMKIFGKSGSISDEYDKETEVLYRVRRTGIPFVYDSQEISRKTYYRRF